VLEPEHPQNYYATRELVPSDLLPDVAKAKIAIVNYHVFKRRETLDTSKTGRALLQGRGPALDTLETDGVLLERACGSILNVGPVIVINDEAHHCYRERPKAEKAEYKGEDKDEA